MKGHTDRWHIIQGMQNDNHLGGGSIIRVWN